MAEDSLKLINGYSEYMRASIKLVEKTRKGRIGNLPRQMTSDERKEVLNLCHPDFAPGGKRTINFGPNKGDIAPNEVVDLIEAYPVIEPKEIDLSKIDYETDILIIGGGLAGTSAALLANDSGVPVDKILLINKLRHGDANSMMAEGGTQAADRPNDSPVIHYIDAYGGGHFTNKPDVLKALVEDAPKVMQWLEELGVIFDKEPDGTFTELTGGGTSRRRMHAARDYTGMEELRVLRDEFRNRKFPVLEYHSAIELLTDLSSRYIGTPTDSDSSGDPAGRPSPVVGAVLWDMETGDYKIVKAKATILATGGFGRLHIRGFPTTNHYGATCDGVVLYIQETLPLPYVDSFLYT